MNKDQLIQFTKEIAELYEQGEIHSPVHLSGGNVDQLIEIFKGFDKEYDWVFSTWRNHWHWLLAGKDPNELKQQILDGHSMHVFGERFFTSAIVGGIAPIAVGVAWGLQLKREQGRVWCFLGDMGASTGIAMESIRWACGHNLPITFVIEDNALSVKTNTKQSWGCNTCLKDLECRCNLYKSDKVKYYYYNREFPHAGTGVFILF